MQLGEGDQPAVAHGGAGEHRETPGGVGGLLLADPGGVPVLCLDRHVPARRVGRHAPVQQRQVVEEGIGRPVPPGDDLVAGTGRGRLGLQRGQPLLVHGEQQVAPGLLQVAAPAVPQREGAAGRVRSGLVDLGDQRRPPGGPGQLLGLLEQRAADAAAAVLRVHSEVDVRDRRVVEDRQQQTEGADDGVPGDRGAVGAVHRAARRDEAASQGGVVVATRRSADSLRRGSMPPVSSSQGPPTTRVTGPSTGSRSWSPRWPAAGSTSSRLRRRRRRRTRHRCEDTSEPCPAAGP